MKNIPNCDYKIKDKMTPSKLNTFEVYTCIALNICVIKIQIVKFLELMLSYMKNIVLFRKVTALINKDAQDKIIHMLDLESKYL